MSSEVRRRRTWTDLFVYGFLRLVLCCVQAMEVQRTDRVCRTLAVVLARMLRIRHRLIDENLQRVFPDWSAERRRETELKMWLHLLRMACELAHARRKIHRTNWYEHFRIPNRRAILEFVFDPRAKLLVTGHFGNFELAGFLTGVFGLPSTTIARELDNAYVHNYVTGFRSSGGQHYISKDTAADAVQRFLDAGGTLTLLADQDAGSRGVWVPFLGHYASCHKALALFTLSSGAPMLVVTNRRLERILQFEVRSIQAVDPLDTGDPRLTGVEALTTWYNGCLEDDIRHCPEQYWWIHRRWREPPPRLAKKASRLAA